MASADKEAMKRLNSLSECFICFMTYTDPRMLPCFHTACLKCFDKIQSKNKNKPGDVLPCPMCRKEFTIPSDGMNGLQKNFFIESLMEVTKAVNFENKSVPCDICTTMEDASDANEATVRCLNCCENYCPRCSKIHKSQKLTKDHRIVEINSELKDAEIRNVFGNRNCKKHSDKVLDYYCSDCKIVVCVSCFVEDHKLHECKDVKSVDKDFRQSLEENSTRIRDYSAQILSKKVYIESKKKEFMSMTLKVANAVRRKRDQLNSLIHQHSEQLLDELYLLKQEYKKQMEIEIEEIERKLTVVESFVTYCSELKSKGSPSEVCDCADNLITRAKELSKENEDCLSSEFIPVEIKFVDTDQNAGNVVGMLSAQERSESWTKSGYLKIPVLTSPSGSCLESSKEFESCFISIDSYSKTLKVSLDSAEGVSKLRQLPTLMQKEAAAAVYRDSVFITGLGNNCDVIWSFNTTSSSWKKCASLLCGRRGHSVAFVDHVLYICGGWVDSDDVGNDDVEAYNTIDNKCAIVGKLVHSLWDSVNLVPYKGVIHIFGGISPTDEDAINVQAYNTKSNTCDLLLKPMPKADCLLRAILFKNVAILLGQNVCLLYDFEKGVWHMRNTFKTGVEYFDVTINDGNIFVIESDTVLMSHLGMDIFHNKVTMKVKCIPVMNIVNDVPIEWKDHSRFYDYGIVRTFGKIM